MPRGWIMNALSLLIGPYIKLILVGVVVLAIGFLGVFIYNKGYSSAELKWSAKYTERENALLAQALAERVRQAQANIAAKKAEAMRIAEMQAENQKLEDLIKELSDEADKDPAANNKCLSPDSQLRINKVR